MLPKSQRLNLKLDFKWVASGSKSETKTFRFFKRLGTNLSPKVGVAIRGSQFKKAHERSEAKRKSFKAIETVYQSLPKQLNLVIMPKASILNEKVEDLIKEIKNAKIND